ncbi:MAG TPA: hypothetical protein VGE26_05830 [Sphingobacteriaceae bacterium]
MKFLRGIISAAITSFLIFPVVVATIFTIPHIGQDRLVFLC